MEEEDIEEKDMEEEEGQEDKLKYDSVEEKERRTGGGEDGTGYKWMRL